MKQPNVLYIMTDQQRFDTIAALGNSHIYTPNMDRLVQRGLSFTNAYSSCPVCLPARYNIRTGCEPSKTAIFCNEFAQPTGQQPTSMTERCGPYLAQTMGSLGYRTFGIGKFHSEPYDEELGYDVHLHSEELYEDAANRRYDAYAAWIAREHPEYDFLEGLMGERTEMYYMPQRSSMPAEATVEHWAAQQAVAQIHVDEDRPYFGLVSFVGPHPPFAPPIPFNRMYDPDRMPNPIKGDLAADHLDEQLPFMNHFIWAQDINDSHGRVLKARYYGEISYIDWCIGKILDAVDARADGDNTLICFFSDHGEHLGDHHAWQKESFFESSCRVPFLLSWPARLQANQRRDELICLTDLFGIATHAGGKTQLRDGMDVLGMIDHTVAARTDLFGYYGRPGTARFKVMLRHQHWKYIYMANGDRQQLFNLDDDPMELVNIAPQHAQIAAKFKQEVTDACRSQGPGILAALDGQTLRAFAFAQRKPNRVHQFDASRGVTGFPQKPEDAIVEFFG